MEIRFGFREACSNILPSKRGDKVFYDDIIDVVDSVSSQVFPWGKMPFDMTMKSLQSVFDYRILKPQEYNPKGHSKTVKVIRIYGCSMAFQFWLYEIDALIAEHCATRLEDSMQHPQVLR